MLKPLIEEMVSKMEKSVEATERELRTIRSSRADASLVEHVRVDYFGTKTPLLHLASFAIPDPRTIVVTPYDRNVMQQIERAISTAGLGVMPVREGNYIRINLPPLTEERRKELSKLVARKGEEGKVAVRNIRRETKERIEALEKEEHVSEDDAWRAQQDILKKTEQWIERIEALIAKKQDEVMTI
jgi:ribosome recycling factor